MVLRNTNDKGERASMYYQDPNTRMTMPISAGVQGANLEYIEKEYGLGLGDLNRLGGVPTAKPVEGFMGASRVTVTPLRLFGTEERVVNVEQYGDVPKEFQDVPDDWIKALALNAMDLKLEDIAKKAPGQIKAVNVARMLREFEDKSFAKPEEMQAALNDLNTQIKGMYPQASKYTFLFDKDAITGRWFSSKIGMGESKWFVIAADTKITVADQEGKPGTLHKSSESGEVMDNTGAPVPEARGASDGDTVMGLLFGKRGKEELKDIGRAILGFPKELMAFLNSILGPEPARDFLRRLIAEMGEEKARAYVENMRKEEGS